MNMGNYLSTKSIKTANASTSTDEDNNDNQNKTSVPRGNSEPSGSMTPQEEKKKSPSKSGSVSDNNQDAGEDDTRNHKSLDPNSKRYKGYKRKLAESSESSDDEESLEKHNTTPKNPNLKKHQVPQPKLPKIITHNNNSYQKRE